MSEFDEAIATTGPDDGGAYRGRLTDDWGIGEAVNGGLLMSLAARVTGVAARAAGGHSEALTFSGVFLSPGAPGEVHVRPTVLRSGRSMTTAQTVVAQPVEGVDVERFRALITLGDLEKYAESPRVTVPPPSMTGVRESVSADDAPAGFAKSGLLKRLDLRLDPATAGWAMGAPSGKGEMRGWLRLADRREPDALSLLLAMDAFPPVVFDLGSQGWAPTIEFTGYVHARPAPGWLQVRTRTDHVQGGLFKEDCQVWDSTGALVAQSRQLGAARFPAS